MLRAVFVPLWGERPLRDIAKADVIDLTDAIIARGTPSAARHAFATIRLSFNWCAERGLVEASPCLTLKPPVKANSRDRVLTDAELATILGATDQVGYPSGRSHTSWR